MDERLPLSAMLSHGLVAFTIEFDNEFERHMGAHGPWLTSLVMYANCMQYVADTGLTVAQLRALARTQTNLAGMERWGYLSIDRGSADGGGKLPHSRWVLRPTRKGRAAREVWRTLFATVETRWRTRHGASVIDELHASLVTICSRSDRNLPDCMPILGYGLISRESYGAREPTDETDAALIGLPLPALLSRVLLAFTLEFERESVVSLALGANVLRLVNEQGIRVRDLPRAAGVSKEAIAMSAGFLAKNGFAEIKTEAAARAKRLAMTAKGERARADFFPLLSEVEQRWHERFGGSVARLRASLEPLTARAAEPLRAALTPFPEGWRAKLAPPATLAHYPMVLHRGGFPDGS